MTDELVRRINELDNRTVLLILGFVAQDLQQEVPAEQTTVIQSEEDTRLAIASFLAPMGESTGQLDAVADIQDNARLAALGRRLLVLLLEDEAARPKVEDLVSNSPEDAHEHAASRPIPQSLSDSKSGEGNLVWVRLPSPAQHKS